MGINEVYVPGGEPAAQRRRTLVKAAPSVFSTIALHALFVLKKHWNILQSFIKNQ